MQITAGVTAIPVTIEQFSQFMKRGFRALKPREVNVKGERAFELYLNESRTLGIRVMTSIGVGQTVSAPEGADAIRVALMNFKKGFPLMRGKQPIVKRTEGWRDNLKDRIEDLVEMYESREEDLEAGRYVDWGNGR